MTAPLLLDLSWQGQGDWFSLHADCEAGITLAQGPGAADLLRLLAGRRIAHRGRALLDGQPLHHGDDAVRHGPTIRPVAALLDENAPRSWHSPHGWVQRTVRVHGPRRRDARARALQALGWVGMGGDRMGLRRRPLALASTAARRRTALAAALAPVPGLLLLDRPCAPLLPAEQAAIYETVRTLAARWEMVVLLIPDAGVTVEGAAVIRPRPCAIPR